MRASGRDPGGRALSTPDGSEFDSIASEYDRVRPSYPEVLVDAACDRVRLGPGSRVLEIGCGTGQLTEMLVARGLEVDAVDPGARLPMRRDVVSATARLDSISDASKTWSWRPSRPRPSSRRPRSTGLTHPWAGRKWRVCSFRQVSSRCCKRACQRAGERKSLLPGGRSTRRRGYGNRATLEGRIGAMIAATGGVHRTVEMATLVTACRAAVATAGVLE